MIQTSIFPVHHIKILDDTVTVAYTDQGRGNDTLFFIHGMGNSMIGWEQNITALSEKYRCIAIDLPGNGLSTKDNQIIYSIDFYSQVVIECIKKIQLGKVTLIGHSMGGQVAIKTAASSPELINKLILIAPAGLERFNYWERELVAAGLGLISYFGTDKSNLTQVLNASFYHKHKSSRDLIKRMVALLDLQPAQHFQNMIAQCIQSMVDQPVWELIPSIQNSTLILFGEMDALIPNRLIHLYTIESLAKESLMQFPDATYEIIPLAGHFLHWEKYDIVNASIDAFVSNK